MTVPSTRKSPALSHKSHRAEYLSTAEIIAAFQRAMLAAGIEIEDAIVPDGELHRSHVKGHRRGTQNGAYILHGDSYPAGWFQDFVSGVSGTWTAGGGEARLDESVRRAIEQAKLQRKAEQEQRQIKKQGEAERLWQAAQPCETHPYLERKGVESHGLRVATWRKWIKDGSDWRKLEIDNTLIVPMMDERGAIWNVQGIFPEPHPELGRDKDFLGGRKAGLFYVLGQPTDSLMIAEGYATGATIHAMTGQQTYVAFDCGNLKAVALIVRKLRPDASIILCADNDRFSSGNPGVTKAREAALAVGGKVSIPEFPEDSAGTDWNDFHRMEAANV